MYIDGSPTSSLSPPAIHDDPFSAEFLETEHDT